MNKNLIFFNNSGYPYNFDFNESTQQYEGRLFFDENSSDTFKTIGLYVFEEVSPISFKDTFKLHKVELYDNSGISFINASSSGDTIINITRVNTDGNFFSKWIHGDNFDSKYPIGSVISLSGITGTNEFNEKYYTVLANIPNAFLINSKTSNSAYTYTYITGATINSHNIISINDYNNTLINTVTSYKLYDNKKLNIVNSSYNDGIVEYKTSGLTNTYYQTFQMTGNTNDVMRVEIELFTERPKIYTGEVAFNISGSTATLNFTRGFNSFFNILEGNSFICEDYNANPLFPNNPIFTVVDGAGEFDIYHSSVTFISNINYNQTLINHFNSKTLSSKIFSQRYSAYLQRYIDTIVNYYNRGWFSYDYYIQIYGNPTYPVSSGDTIQLSAYTNSNINKNDNRLLEVLKYIDFRQIRLDYWTNKIITDANWLDNVKSKSVTNNITLDEQIELDSIWMYNNYDNNLKSNQYIPVSRRYNRIKVNEYVIPESTNMNYNIKKLITLENSKNLICSVSPGSYFSNFTKNVIVYDASNVLKINQNILGHNNQPDYAQTISALTHQYSNVFNDYGIYMFYDNKLNVGCKYALNDNEKFFNFNVYINNIKITNTGITNSKVKTIYLETYSTLTNENVYLYQKELFAKNHHSIIGFNLNNNSSNFGFTLDLNSVDYYIKFTGDTQTTINSFITTYYNSFYSNGLILSSGVTSGMTSLNIDAIFPNVEIYSLSIKVNMYSTYKILLSAENSGIFISGNELQLPNTASYTFYDYGLSTGMIISLTGSTYSFNNKEYNIIGLNPNTIELSYQGAFYNDTEYLSIKTKSFLRKPRESYTKDIYYSLKWKEKSNIDTTDTTDNIFFYDFSGEQLKPYMNDSRYAYIGTKPLWDTKNVCSIQNTQLYLRDETNKNISDVLDPTKQQTVFRGKDGNYCLNYLLDKYESSSEFNFIPEPLQIFVGFNSPDEGVSSSILLMDKVENVILSGYSNSLDYNTGLEFEFTIDGFFRVKTDDINFSFNTIGFEKDQLISINFTDLTITGTTNFENYGNLQISHVSSKEIKINNSGLTFNYFNTSATTNSFMYEIKVLPRTILNCTLYGESEIEDERLSVSLNNLGIQVGIDDEPIFIDSDINEHGYDYKLLNTKRKEMLSLFPEIYNYVGSYKAIINSINFFGWNDLKFEEYYKNVNPKSELYQKLFKVQIPDIFDNTVEGYTPNDWIIGKYQTGDWKKTNLFNLTYDITDEQGNFILLYSLDEVQIKLNKLKRWLKRNMIPLSANIVDITGVAETVSNQYQEFDVSNQIKKPECNIESTSVNFNIIETLNFETNYMVQIDFYTMNGLNLSGWTAKIRTFSMSEDGTNKLIPQKYYKLFKNDMNTFSFNIDRNIDQYLYVETSYYNNFGLGEINNKMINTSTFKNYLLINNNFRIPLDYPDKYLTPTPNTTSVYSFDKDGFIYLSD